jgi:hypothetical protein
MVDHWMDHTRQIYRKARSGCITSPWNFSSAACSTTA